MNEHKITGALLLAAPLIPIAGTLLLVLRTGYRPVIGDSLADLERLAGQIVAHRWSLVFWMAGNLSALAGLALLVTLLTEPAAKRVASVALTGILLAAVLVVVEASFHASVTVWAAGESSVTGAVPPMYGPLRQWVDFGQGVYTFAGLLALIGLGWALQRDGLLPTWVGWATGGWSGLWLVVFLAFRATAPGVLLIPPALIGAAILLSPSTG